MGDVSSFSTLNYGLQANMLFPSERISGWAGLFAGLESIAFNGTVVAAGIHVAFTDNISGWQAGVQGGADWKVASSVVAGPFVSLGFGQYGSGAVEIQGRTTSQDIANKATHEWLTVGLRGSYGL